jgi:hypothetical protein
MKTVVVVLGVVGMLVALDPAAAQQLVSAAGPASQAPAKPYRVVNLKNGSFVIDTPGTWVLNRSWRFEDLAEVPLNIIDVVADDVVLDFRGFEIEVEGSHDPAVINVINVQGHRVTLRDAVVSICCGESGFALHSTGESTVIEGLRGLSFAGIRLEGTSAVLRDSSFRIARAVRVNGSSATIENTFISCGFIACVILTSDDNNLLNSRFEFGGDFSRVLIAGNRNVVAGNLIEWEGTGSGSVVEVAIDIRGNANVVRDNTVAAAGVSVVVNAAGTGNVIDGNIGADMGERSTIRTGIRFEQDGNFYGDNRMDAVVPFDLGGTTQTNWGGNVGY